MSRFLELQKWLPVVDAAQLLSEKCGVVFTCAQVLRLALDGKLKLSVRFVMFAYARRGKVSDEADVHERIRDLLTPPSASNDVRGAPPGIYIGNNRMLALDDDVARIVGIWELPMIRGERIDVERQYSALIGGPAITLSRKNETFVENADGVIFQLYERVGENEYLPSLGLLDDGMLVVRAEALRDFEQSMHAPLQQTDSFESPEKRCDGIDQPAEKAPGAGQACSVANSNCFQEMQGIRWDEISITFVDDDVVKIAARGTTKRFTFSDLGFRDTRRNESQPIGAWRTLREVYALRIRVGDKIKDRNKTITKKLKKFFGIARPLFSYQGERWEPSFKITYAKTSDDALDHATSDQRGAALGNYPYKDDHDEAGQWLKRRARVE